MDKSPKHNVDQKYNLKRLCAVLYCLNKILKHKIKI